MISPSSPARSSSDPTGTGVEWVVDAYGCQRQSLRDVALIRSVCQRIVSDLALRVVGEPHCHPFPDPGGVTALYLLSESHLAVHTYPEYSLATFNLYCCRRRQPWPWQHHLSEFLDAREVVVRQLSRGEQVAEADRCDRQTTAPEPLRVPSSEGRYGS